jgi:hypothetical protein
MAHTPRHTNPRDFPWAAAYRAANGARNLAVLFVPAFFVVVQRFENWRSARKAAPAKAISSPAHPVP